MILYVGHYVTNSLLHQLGIPGCGKHSLCKELLNAPGCVGDSRPIGCLTGDFTMKDEYWNKVTSERIRNPYSILLADKNIEPDGEVWNKIEDICHHTRSSAIPVVPDSIGTESNAFRLDALAVFMFRVLQRVNHPGNLDKDCPNAGYIMLKSPLPADVKSVLEEGINLYQLEKEREGRWDYSKELYAEEWAKWEKKLRETLLSNADYFNSVQVVEQLSLIAKGRPELAPSNSLRCYGNLGAADLDLHDEEIKSVLDNTKRCEASQLFLLARFGLYRRGSGIDVKLTALVFDENMAALEVQLSAEGENIKSAFPWTHSIVWSKERASERQTNTDMLPELLAIGNATPVLKSTLRQQFLENSNSVILISILSSNPSMILSSKISSSTKNHRIKMIWQKCRLPRDE
ncbi:trna ligase 1 [Citrus sinensis]|uniref:Trna ligase 1 n=1 Tax=Citrus sinensis TaxID=2711 RepID=A0ACB8IWW2_CITSI|nr:trna ligase 1 [Citrus sinensis]